MITVPISKKNKFDDTVRRALFHLNTYWLFRYDKARFVSGQDKVDLWPTTNAGRIRGSLAPEEKWLLYNLATQLPEESTIFEIGCFGGLSTYFLGKGAEISDSQVYSVDPFASEMATQVSLDDGEEAIYLQADFNKPSLEDVQAVMDFHDLTDRVTLIEGFSHSIDWEDKPIDLLWIDGNHAYDAVVQDFEKYGPLVNKGGFVAFHDSVAPYGKKVTIKAIEDTVSASPEWEILGKQHSITYARKL